MQNQQLVDYINQSLAAGQTKEQIKQSLLQIGWREGDINEAFGGASANIATPIDFQQPKKFPIKLLIGIISGIVILSAIGGGVYWRQKYINKNNQIETQQINQSSIREGEKDILIKESPEEAIYKSMQKEEVLTDDQNKIEEDVQKRQTTSNESSAQQVDNVYTIKIKLDSGEIVTRNVTLAEYEKYQSALSLLPITESSKLGVSTAFPPEECELGKSTFGMIDVQVCKLASVINFSPISDVYIVNVLTDDKKNVVDFTPFPLNLAIDLPSDALKIDPSKLSIYYWGGTSICSEKGCGYYVAMLTNIDAKNKQATATITRPGQYLLGVKK